MTDPLEGLRDRGFLLAWDPMKEADLPEVAKLNEAIEHIDDTAERHSLGELTEAVNQSRADLGQIGVVGRDDRGLRAGPGPASGPQPAPGETDRGSAPGLA